MGRTSIVPLISVTPWLRMQPQMSSEKILDQSDSLAAPDQLTKIGQKQQPFAQDQH